MEKGVPHCKLSVAVALVRAGKVRLTRTAIEGGAELGLTSDDIIGVVCDLPHRGKFYKSMTTRADHRVWQDVYHTRTSAGVEVYLKLTVMEDVLVVSFKEL